MAQSVENITPSIEGLTNFRRNRLGGIDADKNGMPYTLSDEEALLVTDPIAEYDDSAVITAENKAQQQAAMDSLTVEVDGFVFQANERSRQRMADAILAADYLGQTEHIWRMADDTQRTITLAQLKQAHALAMVAFGQIILE